MDVHVKFGDSKVNHSRDIRAAHFVMDDDEQTTMTPGDTGQHIRQNIILALPNNAKLWTQSDPPFGY